MSSPSLVRSFSAEDVKIWKASNVEGFSEGKRIEFVRNIKNSPELNSLGPEALKEVARLLSQDLYARNAAPISDLDAEWEPPDVKMKGSMEDHRANGNCLFYALYEFFLGKLYQERYGRPYVNSDPSNPGKEQKQEVESSMAQKAERFGEEGGAVTVRNLRTLIAKAQAADIKSRCANMSAEQPAINSDRLLNVISNLRKQNEQQRLAELNNEDIKRICSDYNKNLSEGTNAIILDREMPCSTVVRVVKLAADTVGVSRPFYSIDRDSLKFVARILGRPILLIRTERGKEGASNGKIEGFALYDPDTQKEPREFKICEGRIRKYEHDSGVDVPEFPNKTIVIAVHKGHYFGPPSFNTKSNNLRICQNGKQARITDLRQLGIKIEGKSEQGEVPELVWEKDAVPGAPRGGGATLSEEGDGAEDAGNTSSVAIDFANIDDQTLQGAVKLAEKINKKYFSCRGDYWWRRVHTCENKQVYRALAITHAALSLRYAQSIKFEQCNPLGTRPDPNRGYECDSCFSIPPKKEENPPIIFNDQSVEKKVREEIFGNRNQSRMETRDKEKYEKLGCRKQELEKGEAIVSDINGRGAIIFAEMQQANSNMAHRLDLYSAANMWRDSGKKSQSAYDERRDKMEKDEKSRSIIGIAYQGDNPIGKIESVA